MSIEGKKKKKPERDMLGTVLAFNKDGTTFEIDLDARKEFQIFDDPKEWLIAMARVYAYWCRLYKIARDVKQTAEIVEKEIEFAATSQEADRRRELGQKDVKVTEIKASIGDNAKVQQARRNAVRAEAVYEGLSGVLESLAFMHGELQTYAKIFESETRLNLSDQ